MNRYLPRPLMASMLLMSVSALAEAQIQVESSAFAINDMIETAAICEEYDLNELSDSDAQLVLKYYKSGHRCPAENRVGRCIGFKAPGGIPFDKHYYHGTAERYDWEPSSIKVTCKNVGGKYKDGRR